MTMTQRFFGPSARGFRQPARRAALPARIPSFPRDFATGGPFVMGVLNVTPDSFSDGGRFLLADRAIARAAEMLAEGAALVDVGAESTRPYGGAHPVDAGEEIARLAPVLPSVVALGAPVSLDTMKASVARWGLEQGIAMINDVWGLQRDADMARVVADFGAGIIVMHNRDSADPDIDIIGDIVDFFARSLDIAERAGVAQDRIALDPGIGFGKTHRQSLEALAKLGQLKAFGLPLVVGASRKRFIDSVSPSRPEQRLGGSIAAHILAVDAGASVVRVHDVAETAQAMRVFNAIREAR
jgi:dihydropteroate synthase